MKSDSIIFYHPITLTLDYCRTVMGNMFALHGILTGLPSGSVPTLIDMSQCKVGVLKVGKYFIILSGPCSMSDETMSQQVRLFIDSMIFFLGPLETLSLHYSADQVKMSIRKVSRHIITHVIPDRGVTFRNNIGYLPCKVYIPLDCTLKCSTVLDGLEGVYGGVVMHDKKIVYTSLNSCLLSVIQGLEETSIPVDITPSLEKVAIVRVFLTAQMWASFRQATTATTTTTTAPEISPQLEELLDNIDCPRAREGSPDSITPVGSNFELVDLDVPEDGFASSKSYTTMKALHSFSSQNSKFSLINELFESKGKGGKGKSRSAKISVPDSFHDSLESQLSASELPGNSLNYKLLAQDAKESSPAESVGLSDHVFERLTDKPSDSTSNDSVYHETHEFIEPFLNENDLKVCDILVQTRMNTTIILFGEHLSDKIQDLWSSCLLLLGEVNACFNIDKKPKTQKTTQGVNSFIFNKVTKNLQFSNAGKTLIDSHKQIKFCKEFCDDEDDVDMICVRGLNCSTVVKNTASANVFLTSHSMRCSKLADNLTDITGRNFDSVFL